MVLLLLFITAPSAHAAPPAEFGAEGSGAGQFREPRGLAIEQSSGAVYLADAENQRVDKFSAEGQFLLAFGWGVADGSGAAQSCLATCLAGQVGAGAGQFHHPGGVAVDNSPGASHGDLYVLDLENLRVEKFGPAGEFLLMFGGEVDKTSGADICTAADLQGGDQCGAGVVGPGQGEFLGLEPNDIAVGSDGSVYVGDLERVQRFSPAGAFEAETALPGVGFVRDLAVDSTGNLYLTSFLLSGVHKYSPAGAELGPPRDAGLPDAIAVGPDDELLISDAGHVDAFAPGGEQTASIAEPPSVGSASGIAFADTLERIYVLHQSAIRLLTLPAPGPYLTPGSQSATEIKPTTATLGAQVNPEGAETTYRFQYIDAESFATEGGFASSNTQATPDGSLPPDFEDHQLSAPIAGLAPRSGYHFRVLAESECEPLADPGHICLTEGPDQTFTTLPPVSIDSTSVSAVAATSATLEAELNPHGLPSTYRFEYDTLPYAQGAGPHGASTPIASLGAGEADVFRVAQIQGLAPATTYHFRVVAENELGSEAGPDRTFTTQSAAAALLPDGRVWEMVSPPTKHGSPLEPITEEGGLIQAAAGGSGLAYLALGPLTDEPQGVRSPGYAQLLAARGPGGWSSAEIATRHDEISIVRPGFPSEYKFFAADLGSSVVEPEGVTPLGPQASERTPYRREADGTFVPLISEANVPPATEFGGSENPPGSGQWGNGVEFRTATPDASHVLLVSPQHLAAGFGPGFEPNGEPNLYELSAGVLRLLSILPGGEPASEAGLTAKIGANNRNMRGAISADGRRAFFETNPGGHLYLRQNATAPASALDGEGHCTEAAAACTIQLDALQPGAAGGPGKAEFQAASADGSHVFFTDASQLTADSTAKPARPDLYLCQISTGAGGPACALSDLSANAARPGEAADVQGLLPAIDAAGAHVYFAADGVLTETPNAAGEIAVPGDCNSAAEATCNLYAYDTAADRLALVAVLSSRDDPVWAGATNLNVLGGLSARSSPDGHFFAFMSARPLSGYDNRDAGSGARDEEVFLYDSKTGQLRCPSCNPTGARPRGVFDRPGFPGLLVDHAGSWGGKNATPRWLAASIPGWTLGPSETVALYQSRYLSNSGRLFFNSADALVPQDTNGVMDVYQYEPPGVGDCTTSSSTYSTTSGGCVSLISSGTSAEESAFLDASESGDDVFFLTQSKLASTDVDNALDVYDASVGGKTYETVKPVECSGDACQQPATPPLDPTPGSLTFNGAGNVLQCPKGKVKKSGKCVKRKKGKGHKKGQSKSKRGSR